MIASKACSSFKAYLKMIPGVASGIFVSASNSFGIIRGIDDNENLYLAFPIGLITHSNPSGAYFFIVSGKHTR